jgi:hypothetical protein
MADYIFNIYNEETDLSIRVYPIRGEGPDKTVPPQNPERETLTYTPQSGDNFVAIGIDAVPSSFKFTDKTYIKLVSFTEGTYFRVKRIGYQTLILEYGIPTPDDPETTVRIGEDQ